jgi:site-specific DNA-methyltransferase (adenine-specific)
MIHSSIENVQPEQVMNNEQKMMESTSAQVLPMQCYAPFSGSPSSELYNMDCVAGMKHYPDKYFDLAIVDPPYGININMNLGRRKGKRKKHIDKNWDYEIPNEAYFIELWRVSKNRIIWGGNYFDLPPTQCFLIWDKAESMYDRSFAECEQAWTSFQTSARMFKMCPNQNDRIHPTQKPIQLYNWILKRFAEPGQRILDTHVGSGSSRIACYLNGFDFVGFEIDEDYCQSSEKRFRNAIKQQRLF